MWKVLRMIGIGILVVLLILVLLFTYRLYAFGKESQAMSPQLGLVDGTLKACPNSPNCVSSYSSGEQHQIASFSGGAASLEVLRSFLSSQPNVSVITEDAAYIHATFTSKIFKFVDDLELYLDGEEVQVRSASRVGYSDLDANRKRVEILRSLVNP